MAEYFHTNAGALLSIPWELGVTFTDAEKTAIAASVQEFQLGESSEAKHFQGLAKEYAQRTGDEEYVYALRLFIAEEHRHARDLGACWTWRASGAWVTPGRTRCSAGFAIARGSSFRSRCW